MKEIQATTLDQLVLRRSKVNSALEKVGNLVASPNSIINKNLKQSTEESSNLHKHEIVRQIIADGLRRKEIHQRLQEKTEPYLKSLGLKIDDEILKRETKEDSDSILDEKGVFALASIWASNPSLAAEYGVEPLPQQVVLNLRPLIGDELLPTPEQQKEIAAPALGKILEVVNSDNLDQVYDSQPPPVQDLLLHLTTIDPESVVNFLNKALSECDETVQPATLAEPTVDKMPDSPKLKEIERRDPQIRETLNTYLERIEAVTDKPIYRSQLTRFFPQIKANFIDIIERDKGYITPQRGRDGHHPVFSKEEIAILFYLKEYGKNLDPRRIKELKEIVAEEIGKRGQNNGNKNGATKDQSSPRVTIEQPQGPRVNGPKPPYSLEKSKTEDERQIPEFELSAINLFIGNPEINLGDVAVVLGEGEPLTSDQIQSELAEAAAKLYEKITQGSASLAEIEIWEKIKNKTKMGENKDALREFRSGIKARFQGQKRVEDQTISAIIVEEEVVAEAEEAVTQPPEETASPVIEDDQITLDENQPTPKVGWRGKFLSRFRGIGKKETITQVPDRQKEEKIQSSLPISHKEHPPQEYLDQIKEQLLKRYSGDLIAIEMEHPSVRADIYYYFDLMSEIRNWPLNPQRLTQVDTCLTWAVISPLLEKKIFSRRNFSGRPTFSKSDVALALIVLHHEIDLTQDNLKDLRQIIKEEEAFRNQQKKSE